MPAKGNDNSFLLRERTVDFGAGGAFEDADKTRFAGAVLSEDDRYTRREEDLRAGLERVDTVPNLQAV